MGGWLLLVLANWAAGCLTGCCAPFQLLLHPSRLPRCPHSAHPQDDKESWALLLPPRAVKMPCHFRICPLSRLQLECFLCPPLAPLLPPSSLLYNSSFSTKPDLCNAISPLAIYGRGCHGNYGLYLSFTRPPLLARSLSLSLSLLFSPLSTDVRLCHVIALNLLFFPPQRWRSHKECVCVQYCMCMCVCVSVLKRTRERFWDSETGQSINSTWRERRIYINKQSRNITLMCSEDFISMCFQYVYVCDFISPSS